MISLSVVKNFVIVKMPVHIIMTLVKNLCCQDNNVHNLISTDVKLFDIKLKMLPLKKRMQLLKKLKKQLYNTVIHVVM